MGLQMLVVQMDERASRAKALLAVPMLLTLALLFLLAYAGRLSDAFLAGLALIVYWITCLRERTYCNYHALLLLWVLSFLQCFLAAFRLLMLQAGAADELAPSGSHRRFIIFAIGVVAAPTIHFFSCYWSWKLFDELRRLISAPSPVRSPTSSAPWPSSLDRPPSPSLVSTPTLQLDETAAPP